MRQLDTQGEEGGNSLFYLSPAVPASKMLENMRSSLSRGLPEATVCKAHGLTMSIAGGGPSLADTHESLEGWVCAINGSLKWLADKGLKEGVSYACGVCDAGEHIADMIVALPNVRYYVASICDPKVFDKLEGYDVRLWHVTPNSTEDPEGVEAVLNAHYKGEWMAIGGGCTMGLRWIDLGYFLGFRKFHLHGLDSSFGSSTHAYPDRADDKIWLDFGDRKTRPNFLAQVYDFAELLERLWRQDCNIEIQMFGDGLLQDEWKAFREANPEAFSGKRIEFQNRDGIVWPADCRHSEAIVASCENLIHTIKPHLRGRQIAIQAGGNVGVLAKGLAGLFRRVITVEPDDANFACLTSNVIEPNVTKYHAALGNWGEGGVGLKRLAGNSGASYIEGPGMTQVITIDGMELERCDLIVLDIEGYELAALKGAESTIRECKPVIVVEDKGHGARYGVAQGEIETYLRETFGYSVVHSDGRDLILTC